MLDVQIKGGLG